MRAPGSEPDSSELAAGWAASGAMALTGRPDELPLMAPRGMIARLVALGREVGVDALELLTERAAVAGLGRQGDRSCGDASRLLLASDGWVVVTLARDDDVTAVPAWLGVGPDDDDPWPLVAGALAERPASEIVERGRLLGLPVAIVGSVLAPRATESDVDDSVARLGVRATRYATHQAVRRTPLVVDLSSLWAGPLCARLLGDLGAQVVKVESVHRPDGARRGPAAFFDLMHAGHRSVALDFKTAEGLDILGRLLRIADVVIEASRPRALAQMGLSAETLMAAEGDAPAVWISITGYGRADPGSNWVGFGDDAAAAGGLVAQDDRGTCFVADAIGDPLAGLAATAAARVALERGGRWLLDVPMASVAAHVAAAADADADNEGWTAATDATAPEQPRPRGAAPRLGEDTDAVLSELLTTPTSSAPTPAAPSDRGRASARPR